jgi:diguanylate cyclase (GGDEF)-like protein
MFISMAGGTFCLLSYAIFFPRYKELRYWLACLALGTFSAFTFFVRDSFLTEILIVLGNTAVFSSFLIAAIGVNVYYKKETHYSSLMIAGSVIFAGTFVWLTFVNDSLTARIIIGMTGTAISCAVLGITLIYRSKHRRSTATWFGAFVILQSLIYLVKAAGALYQDPANFYAESLYNNLTFGSAIITGVFFPIGFLLMCNEKLIGKVWHDSNIDSLTQLLNRRYFYRKINKYYSRSENKGKGASLLIIDIDYLKPINDIHGHLAGDIVLKALAEVLTKNILNKSIAARFGGDEFVVFMPKTNLRKAAAFAEIINDNFSKKIRELDYTDPSPSLSIGVASADRPRTIEIFLKHADENLYEAKRQGRNQIVASVIISA